MIKNNILGATIFLFLMLVYMYTNINTRIEKLNYKIEILESKRNYIKYDNCIQYDGFLKLNLKKNYKGIYNIEENKIIPLKED